MKTPIQELKEDLLQSLLDTTEKPAPYSKRIIDVILRSIDEGFLQKEKAFAFDCFNAGATHGMDISDSIEWGNKPSSPDFEQFYSQYAEQHNK